MLTSRYQLTWKTPRAELFDQRSWKRRGVCLPQLAAICAAHWEPCDTRFWQRCDETVDGTTRGSWQGSRAMQVMFALGLEFALSRSDDLAPREITRIGPQDDMTFHGVCCCTHPLLECHWGRAG